MEEKKKEGKRNMVATVFTESAIRRLESLMHWYWDEAEHTALTHLIMKMLSVYVKHCSDEVHFTEKPEWLAEHLISDIIQYNEQMTQIMEEESVWQWKDSPDGWVLPDD